MKIIVTTDSTSDISKEFQKKYEISVMPLIVNLREEEFLDGENITNKDIFEFVEKQNVLPKTAARSPEQYKEFFENAIKKFGADRVIHISLSNEISSSYQNAKIASMDDERIAVIDSRSLSSGSGLLALSAVDKINEGKTFEETVKLILEEVEKVQASFILNDLKYLYKGGRCSALSVFGANILRIKPKIKLSEGKMGVDKKYMGKLDMVIDRYVDDLLNDNPNPVKKRVYVTYTTSTDEINKSIKEKLEAKGFEEIIFNDAGSTIASHCGKNCLGVLFINN
ncbi:MAG: DegV family protein [Firmicutes bacterium]|nr:DegV family protein [Bacillota bacterium]MDY3659253.1 DegV family protein [Eubacteriales bacterium]